MKTVNTKIKENIYLWVLVWLCKTNDVYKEIAQNIETRFDTSNYELERPLPRGKNEKVIWLMKDELGKKRIMTKFVGLRAKTYSYLIHDNSEDKFENYKSCLETP